MSKCLGGYRLKGWGIRLFLMVSDKIIFYYDFIMGIVERKHGMKNKMQGR